jgi:hypothetical protein
MFARAVQDAHHEQTDFVESVVTSMSNLVSVQYRNKDNPEVYTGREYTYLTAIDLAVGDLVMAPVRDGFSVAQVSAINVPESKVDERIMPLLKTIEKMYEPEADPETDAEADNFNLCDTCIHEFAICSGKPEFGNNIDGVVKCSTYESEGVNNG